MLCVGIIEVTANLHKEFLAHLPQHIQKGMLSEFSPSFSNNYK